MEYECVLIANPNLNEGEFENLAEKIKDKMNELVKVTKFEDLGIKKLAYEIRKNNKGHYFLYQFRKEKTKNNEISEIERYLRITDEIMKYIIVRKD